MVKIKRVKLPVKAIAKAPLMFDGELEVQSKIVKWFPGSTVSIPMSVLNTVQPPNSGLNPSAFWDIHTHGITQSMIELWLVCRRKADFKIKHGLKESDYNPACDFGTLFHDVLDKVYSYVRDRDHLENAGIGLNPGYKALSNTSWQVLADKALDDSYKKVSENADPSETLQIDTTHRLCELVLKHYFEWWKREDSLERPTTRIQSVEEEFSFPYTLRNGVQIPIRGKIDRLDLDSKGNYWLFETKTKTEIADMGRCTHDAIVEKMSYQLQVNLYALAVKHRYGKYPRGVKYNLVKRPGQEFKGTYNSKPETLEQFLQRVEADMVKKANRKANTNEYFLRYGVSLLPEEIETWKLSDFDQIVEDIYSWAESNKHGYRNSRNCVMYRKPCPYLSICSGEEKLEDFEVRDRVFSELSGLTTGDVVNYGKKNI